jgi:hypothetical protein
MRVLTIWSRGLLDKLIVANVVNKVPIFINSLPEGLFQAA